MMELCTANYCIDRQKPRAAQEGSEVQSFCFLPAILIAGELYKSVTDANLTHAHTSFAVGHRQALVECAAQTNVQSSTERF